MNIALIATDSGTLIDLFSIDYKSNNLFFIKSKEEIYGRQ